MSHTPSEEAEGVEEEELPVKRVAVPRWANRPEMLHIHNTCRHGNKKGATLLSNARVTSLDRPGGRGRVGRCLHNSRGGGDWGPNESVQKQPQLIYFLIRELPQVRVRGQGWGFRAWG